MISVYLIIIAPKERERESMMIYIVTNLNCQNARIYNKFKKLWLILDFLCMSNYL